MIAIAQRTVRRWPSHRRHRQRRASAPPLLAHAIGQAPSLATFLIGGTRALLRQRRKIVRRRLKDYPEKAVHALRVNTRRLLAHLELIAPLLPRACVEDARRALRRQMKALAPLRDIQVQLLRVEAMLSKHPNLQSFRLYLQRRRQRAVRSADGKLSRRKHARRIAKLEKALRALPAKNTKIPATARRAYAARTRRTLDRAFARIIVLQRRAASEPKWLHQMRIALKTYRYMYEALPPELSAVKLERLHALHAFQERTGEIHDLALLERRLEKFMARNDRAPQLETCRKAFARQRTRREHGRIELTPALLAHPSTSAQPGTLQHQPIKSQRLRGNHASAR